MSQSSFTQATFQGSGCDWEARYQAGQTGWDLGQVAPPLANCLTHPALIALPKTARIVVPGAGRGHDAAYFAQAGWQVTGLDIAPSAVQQAKAQYGEMARFVQADLFDLPRELTGQFDLVVEHTCFCAIEPKWRPAYVQSVANLLKPDGALLGLFWAHQEPDGPPFGTTLEELTHLFTPTFSLHSVVTPENSVPSRATEELLIWMSRPSQQKE